MSDASHELDFRAVFEAIPGAYWVVDARDFCVVAASDAFLSASRTRREDIVGRPLFEVFPGDPDDPKGSEGVRSLRDSLERVKVTGLPDEMTVQRYPIPVPPEEGGGFEERYWSAVNAPVRNARGDITHIVHRTEDITHLVRLQEAEGRATHDRNQLESRAERMERDIMLRAHELQRLNTHLEFAQRVARIGSWEFDVRGGHRSWSDEVYRILGLDREEMPAGDEAVDAVVHPDDRAELDEARRRALAGEINEFEHRVVRPDGDVRWVRERAEVVRDDDGNAVRLFGTIQDITEQRRADERLRQNEHLLRVAGEIARLGAWQLDVADGRVTWSDEVFRIHDLEPGHPVTLDDAAEFVAPEWRDDILEAVKNCIRDGTPFDREVEVITATGRRVWVRSIASGVRDEHGDVACIQGALQDISPRREAEAQVRELSSRLTETLESISDGFATLDNEWRITYLNTQAERIMQRPRDDLLGKDIWQEYPELAGTEFERKYRLAMERRETLSFEAFFSPLRIWLEVTVYPAVNGLALYFRNLTERRRIESEFREQSELTRLMIENALDAVINIDAESVIRVWNPQAERIFGWRAEEAIGRRLHELIIPPEYRSAHRRGMVKFQETGKGPLINNRVEVTALRHDGERFPIELSISPIQSGGNWIFSAFIRDISERKRAERAVHESEQRFRNVARVTTDTIWEWNIPDDTFWWNDGIESVFGYRPEDVGRGSDWWKERIHPDDRERVTAAMERVIEGVDDEWRDEYRFRRNDNSFAFVIDRGYLVRDFGGAALRIIGGMTDISRRKEYETRLAEQAELLDKAHEAIIVLDLDGRVTYWNKAAERMYGWSADEAVGQLKHKLLAEDPEQFRGALRTVRQTGEWTGEVVQHARDGHSITAEVAWSLVTGDDGKARAIFSIINDITDRLALEEQLRQSQRLESIGQLTGGVAHDFNNLLTVILGNSELLVDQLPAESPLRKLAEMSRAAAQRGSDLTHRLLAFARKQTLAPKVTDINRLVVDLEGLLRRTLPDNVDLETVPGEDAWHAHVDASQLESVLLNLAINAKDAMPRGGVLTIETANAHLDEAYADNNMEVEPGDYVMIAVSDTGTGIARENLDRVFDPFFTTKEKGKGTGLGLSMAYGFAKQSRGHIKIYSEPGQGTTVRLYLPRAGQAKDEKSVPARKASPSGHEKILVVEDDELVRQYASQQLEGLGYEVTAASDGKEALRLLREDEDVDLLFTDVIMPGGMNGPQLADEARRLKPDIKVLYTSGYTENAIVHHGKLDEGVRLLQKPYHRADLARTVRDALNDGPA